MGDQVGDAMRQRVGLPRTRASDNQEGRRPGLRALNTVLSRCALRIVELRKNSARLH